jgi:hypothetical protein
MSRLNAPAKVFFTWRVLHGLVHGVRVLANRYIKILAQCLVCQQGDEYVKHLVFTYKRANEVSKSFGVDARIDTFLLVDRSGSVVLEESEIQGENHRCWAT